MSDIDNFSDNERLGEIVYYDGNNEDIYRYLHYFETNYPLCSKDIDNEITNEYIESDHNHFISVVTSFLLYEWDSIKDVIRIERNLNSLSMQDRKLLEITNFENEINQLRKCIAINQNFFKLMLSPDLYYEFEYNESNSNYSCLCYSKKFSNHKFSESTEEDIAEVHTENNFNEYILNRDCSNYKNISLTQVDCDLEENNLSNFPLDQVMSTLTSEAIKNNNFSNKTNSEKQRNNKTHYFSQLNNNNIPNTTINNLYKTRATLRQFVRDWSQQGYSERSESYDPIIQALLTYLPLGIQDSKKKRVLIPGAGLGRLLFEVARLGYICQGNEISYAMLLGSNFILNYMFKKNSITIYPYVLSLSNRPKKEDHLRPVFIPDICVSDYIRPDHDLSMCAGEFVEIYSKQKQAWDAILTCFFLDTARNIITYIRTIIDLLPPQGVWINMGPLLYHYSGMNDVISIELSWEEIKKIISKYFDIVKEEWRNASYIRNDHSMFKVVYKCIFFVAIRNQVLLE